MWPQGAAELSLTPSVVVFRRIVWGEEPSAGKRMPVMLAGVGRGAGRDCGVKSKESLDGMVVGLKANEDTRLLTTWKRYEATRSGLLMRQGKSTLAPGRYYILR